MLGRWLPIVTWLPRYRPGDLGPDLAAGLLVVTMAIPQAMAYAQIAGLHPVVGLYATIPALFAYAVFGHCRSLSVGPVASGALISATGLRRMAAEGTTEYVELAATLGVLAGVVLIVQPVARLGVISRYLSEPVLGGFASAIGVLVVLSQLGEAFGYDVDDVTFREGIWDWARQLDETNAATLLVAAAGVVFLVLTKRWPLFPSALCFVIVATVVVSAADLSAEGVTLLPDFEEGLPAPAVPETDPGAVRDLFPTAIAVALVAFASAFSYEKRVATLERTKAQPNGELFALGAGNMAAGVFQGMPIGAVLSRTSAARQVGVRTPLVNLVAGALLAVVVVAAAGIVAEIPEAALASVVVVAGAGLIRWSEARELRRIKRSDFWLMLVTFVATLGLGIERGLAVAVLVSLVAVVARTSRPRVWRLGLLPGTSDLVDLVRHPAAETVEGVFVIRLTDPLFFANVEYVGDEIDDMLGEDADDVRAVVVDCAGVGDLDATAARDFEHIVTGLRDRRVLLVLFDVEPNVLAVMEAAGLDETVGRANIVDTAAEALARAEQAVTGSAEPPGRD